MMRAPRFGLAAALISASVFAHAAVDELPQMGRYMPLYPGSYTNAYLWRDDRDSLFDAAGNEQGSSTPSVAEPTRHPLTGLRAEMLWHFPMFETYGLPYFSGRTHFARAQLQYIKTRTEGGLASFAAAENGNDGDIDEADDLRGDGSGIGDLFLEYGAYLYGSDTPDWRKRESTPLAVFWAFGFNLPMGVYDRDAPVSAGSNTGWLQAKLGLHAQPWRGSFIDAAIGQRGYLKNQDSAYGALAPRQQGDDFFWDISIAQRLLPGLYLNAFASGREGDPNQYRNVRFAPNPPPDSEPENPGDPDKFPTPGSYRDQGTERTAIGVGVEYFLAQRWRLGLHFETPISGRSGEFALPYTERTPAGCTVGATGCMTEPAETINADGQGAGRVYASSRLFFSLQWQFGLGDTYDCPGCTQ